MPRGSHKAHKTLRTGKRIAVLLLASCALATIAGSRSFEYDEAYSVFVTSPVPRPDWPAGVFRAGDVRSAFTLHSGPAAIARALRATDVHPPLYFWVLRGWRSAFGDSLLSMRLLSVGFAVLALAVVGAIGTDIGVPPLPAMLLTLGCYGFAYTAAVARGFALADLLALCGVLLTLRAARRPDGKKACAAFSGLLLGAATLANYLAGFGAVATLVWLGVVCRREWRAWLAAVGAFAAAVPVDLWFFLGQHDSRPGQFPPFQAVPALARLARYSVATVLGGLPLYGPSSLMLPLEVTLTLGFLGLVALVVARWTCIATRDARALLLAGAVAPPFGLLLLGLAFNSTPIELRYLCFATPFVALLISGALGRSVTGPDLRGTGESRWRIAALTGLLMLQAASLSGLAVMPETMQPTRAMAREAVRLAGSNGVILLPRGNDGVGVVGPFLAELPDQARILLFDSRVNAARLCPLLPDTDSVVLARVVADQESRAAVAAIGTVLRQCRDRTSVITATAPPAASW